MLIRHIARHLQKAGRTLEQVPRGRSRAMGRVRPAIATALAALCIATGAPAGGQDFQSGSSGLGDPFFPKAGNGGYDVDHYAIAFTYRPHRNFINATTTIDAHATQDLGRFNLDLRRFEIDAVTVDGEPAAFAHRGQELIITPASGIEDGDAFEVSIAYRGEPKLVQDPDKSFEGWSQTEDGAFVVGEPQGSPGWYPVNDYPTDKATFDFTVRVPNGLTAVANGTLEDKRVGNKWTTFVWAERVLMAPYLATVTTGKFKVTRSRTASGIPVFNAVAPKYVKESRDALREQKQMVDYFQSVFGEYPFENVGAIIDDAPTIGYALETQTKPVYAFVPKTGTVAHEIAHQWLGNDVTLSSWPDIWLNEGFAHWSQWLWREHIGGQTAQQSFRRLYEKKRASDDKFWNPPPAAVGKAERIFFTSIYVRGAMAVQALRKKIGEGDFFELLRRWIADHHLGNASTEDLIALAEEVSDQDLDDFFRVWLYEEGKPRRW